MKMYPFFKNRKEILAKNKLRTYVNKIENNEIQKFTSMALENAPKEFWTAPSSSSGKYHPIEDNGISGSIRHCIKAAQIGLDLSRFYNFNSDWRDIILSATILHDIKKNGEPWGTSTDYTHGLIAYKWLDQFELNNAMVKISIRNAVRYHMAAWIQPETEIDRAKNCELFERVVQLSDYLGSRKDISFYPGVDIKYEL